MNIDASSEVPTGHKKISRRDFLKIAGVSIAGYTLYKYDQILSGLFGNEFDRYTEQAKNFIRDTYGVDVLTGQPDKDSSITGTDLNKYELSRGLGLIIEEIAKYPHSFFRENGVTAIRLLNNVKVNGLNYYGGFAGLEGTIGIAYAAEPFEIQREYFRGVFHHELYHILDYKDGDFDQDDQQWRDIHRCGCQPYMEIGGRDKSERRAPSPVDWFINDYGQRNPIEDRAEFARVLMIPDLHKDLIQRVQAEPDAEKKRILQNKIDSIKSSFLKWSNGIMHDGYWNDLISGNVDWNYFSVRSRGEK